MNLKGCPKCSLKQTESCEGITPAYLDYVSPKIWPDTRYDLMGRNLMEILDEYDDIRKVVIFTHVPVLELASNTFKKERLPGFKLSNKDYYKTRVLMDDLDTEMTNPTLRAEMKLLQPEWPFEK